MVRRLTCFLSIAFAFQGLTILNRVQAGTQFPYQAVVVAEKVEVRCGPGNNFYVTSHAKQNDQVTVHRHDHGGWYMISPPKGSFSWIDASLVKPINSNRGVVTLSPESGQSQRAIVRIGSQLSDDHSFYGRELSNGDEVTILGEKKLTDSSGSQRMYKIAPPAQEFRWVKGEFLVPLSKQIQQQIAVDPYQVPAEHRQRLAMITPQTRSGTPEISVAKVEQKEVEQKEVKTASLPAPGLAAPGEKIADNSGEQPLTAPAPATTASPTQTQLEFTKLQETDRAYSDMMEQEPSEWKLDPIAEAYRELQQAQAPGVAYLASQRLEVVKKRQEIARHFQKFIQVSSETSRRDAQLLAQQAKARQTRLEAPLAFEGIPEEDMLTGFDAASDETSFPAPAPEGVTPQLDGAGILQRMASAPGFPGYALVAPDGRLLAYVEPGNGVELESWIGKPTGIVGMRQHEPNYGADLIRAQKLIPVNLTR